MKRPATTMHPGEDKAPTKEAMGFPARLPIRSPLYGFQWAWTTQECLVPCMSEQRIIGRIEQLYAETRSVRATALALWNEGRRNRAGGKITPAMIRRQLARSQGRRPFV